ncbi:MAG TPA: hypothetical protein DCS07_10370 [Bdellovibrionales bacterium]|nr:MAG: hypothetical protein A2Z97_00925 [Bdellovibrionales bacterium GWB1_52_6]OFZ03085.1 MAG: hypothetical protein A2X97_09615 [Bdellovibrionales bacterium GWA1_52_35]OFZ37692.1 MAG: hypothetical protein A2070_13765 [Bdellovibrionales bacterium GWC1_52_8]HAR43015.1 hypothetical protein [Bdellovibrionales bacterium]HCM40413.1 hypothetical protein [Bdellovibrionales bacterium]
MGLITGILLAIWAVTGVQADTCSPIRLDQGDGPMAGMPIRSQGSLGICYAYVASQLNDCWEGQKLKRAANISSAAANATIKPSSALYASIGSSLDPRQKNLTKCPDRRKNGDFDLLVDGGRTCVAVETLAKSGSCSDDLVNEIISEQLESSKFTRPSAAALAEAEKGILESKTGIEENQKSIEKTTAILAKLPRSDFYYNSLKDNLVIYQANLKIHEGNLKIYEERKQQASTTPSQEANSVRALYDESKLVQACPQMDRCPRVPDKTNPPQPNILSVVARAILEDMKQKFDQGGCAKSSELNPTDCKLECDHRNFFSKSSLKARIHEALERPNPMPIGISICAAIIRSEATLNLWQKEVAQPGSTIPAFPEPGASWKNHPFCEPHAVLIVGRQKNPLTQKCQLVIRNSWGSVCERMATCTSASCSCEKDTGQLLIDEELVAENTWDIQTVPSPFNEKSCK